MFDSNYHCCCYFSSIPGTKNVRCCSICRIWLARWQAIVNLQCIVANILIASRLEVKKNCRRSFIDLLDCNALAAYCYPFDCRITRYTSSFFVILHIILHGFARIPYSACCIRCFMVKSIN